MRSPIEMERNTLGFFSSRRGSLLILILWVIMLLSFFIVTIKYTVWQRLKFVRSLDIRQSLHYQAQAGVTRALYILKQGRGPAEKKQPTVDSLVRVWAMNEEAFRDIPLGEGSYAVVTKDDSLGVGPDESGRYNRYGVTDEERKINLNKVKAPLTLERLFHAALNISKDDAHVLATCILDWRDADDFPYDTGAESRYYKGLSTPYTPSNRDFVSLEELLFVKGVSPKIYKALLPYVTLDSNGKVNINTAPKAVLLALGFSESLANKVLLFRNGRDKKPGTKDDGVFADITTAVDALEGYISLDQSEKDSFLSFLQSAALSVESENFLIQSIGRLNYRSQTVVIRCVADRAGTIKRWSETYGQETEFLSPETGVLS